MLDGEYMGKRDGQPESCHVWDVVEFQGSWIGLEMPLSERWAMLRSIIPCRFIVPCATEDFAGFFESSKRPGVEGIVLKRLDSRFFGSYRENKVNTGWLKIRWRGGEDGQLRL